jgi:hypothetical protein
MESINAIARTAGKTSNAVSVALHRVRRNLLARLVANGLTEGELRGYLPGPTAAKTLPEYGDEQA